MSLRVLHSSDWHLGRHFMGKTRQAEHQAFCAWLQVQAEATRQAIGDVPDPDLNDIEIWEKPCGGLYAHSKRNGELVLKRLKGEEK